jgi:hypothetical protein
MRTRRLSELAYELVARGGVTGPRRRALQVVLAETGCRKDLADDAGVSVGAAVAGGGQGQPLAFQRDAGGQAAERLQRLHARARQDRRVDVAEAELDHTLGVQHDRRSRVSRLDEATALDDGEFHRIGDRDGAGRCGGTGHGERI